MNKRVTIEMPDEMHRAILRYAQEAGTPADDYLLEVIEQHIEDLHDIAAAEAAIQRIERGESSTRTLDEVVRDLGLDS